MQLLALIAALAAPVESPPKPLPPVALAQVVAGGQLAALRLDLIAQAGGPDPALDARLLPPFIAAFASTSDPGSLSQAATTLAVSVKLTR